MRERFENLVKAAFAAFSIFIVVFMSGAIADVLFKRSSLKIETKSGPVKLDVEIADTDPKRAQGLMFRRSLDDGKGMIFLFEREEEITMWMKDTYIPLDMVFIGTDWRVTRVAAQAEPLSTDIISSGPPAARVLEIGAGQAEKLGVKPGDLVAFHQ